MIQNRARSLTGLALLSASIDRGHGDYLNMFTPIVVDCIRARKGDIVDTPRVVEEIALQYGFRVPHHVVAHVLKRLAASGSIKRDNRAFFSTETLESGRSDAQVRFVSAAGDQAALVEDVRKFVSSHLELVWSPDEAEAALLSYLGRYSIDLLGAFGGEQPLVVPSNGGGGLRANGDAIEYYAAWAFENNAAAFDRLVRIVKGNLLLNGLLCEDIGSINQKYQDVVFYLDTPFVMQLIAMDSGESQKAASELLELVHALDGRTAVFHHTVRELEGVIAAAEAQLDDPGSTMACVVASRRRKLRKSDLRLTASNLRATLERLRVSVLQTPAVVPEFNIDVEGLGQAIGHGRSPSRQSGVEHDVECVRAVCALRAGDQPLRLEEAKAVLVTTNSKYARDVARFRKEHGVQDAVGPVITDYTLVNHAWLKSPLRFNGLLRFEVLARCEAALNPSESMWGQFTSKVEALRSAGKVSAEEFDALRLDPETRRLLMEMRLRRTDIDGGVTAEDVVAEYRRATQGEVGERVVELEQQLARKSVLARRRETRTIAFAKLASSCAYYASTAAIVAPLFYLAYLVIFSEGDNVIAQRIWGSIGLLSFVGLWKVKLISSWASDNTYNWLVRTLP